VPPLVEQMRERRYYYWICTVDENSKTYLVFGGNSEEEARQKGLEILAGVDFELKRYPTHDLSTASAYLRGKRLEETHSLSTASQRIGHSKSLARLKKKYAIS